MYRVEFLVRTNPLIHNCHRGNCQRRAKFTVFDDDLKIENLCVHHAVNFCYQNGLHMPKESEMTCDTGADGETRATSVFVVEHLHTHENGEECVKMIGVYESRTAAEEAVNRISSQPGFRECHSIIDPSIDDETDGFYVEEYRIGEDHWTEGYVTVNRG